jgi:hypothetical protein
VTERVAVGDLGRYGHVFLVSVEGRDARPAEDIDVCHGWGLAYPPPFTGAFAHDGTLWFQAGTRRWDASRIASVRQTKNQLRGATYRLDFVDGTGESVRVRFPLSVLAHRLIDPTYDEIDSWSDDPMKVLPYTASDGGHAGETDVGAWVERVLPLWTSGIPVRRA